MIDLRPACRQLGELVAVIGDEQLDASTPCPEYRVRDLLVHVDEGARGFAAVAAAGKAAAAGAHRAKAGVSDAGQAGVEGAGAGQLEGAVAEVASARDGGAGVSGAGQAEGAGAAGSGGLGFGGEWRGVLGRRLVVLGDAWGEAGAWVGESELAGLGLSNAAWGKIALTEVVVHGWDLARATGLTFELPDETVRACYDHVAGFLAEPPVPELWGPPVEVSAGAPLMDRLVAIAGRRP